MACHLADAFFGMSALSSVPNRLKPSAHYRGKAVVGHSMVHERFAAGTEVEGGAQSHRTDSRYPWDNGNDDFPRNYPRDRTFRC